MNATETCRCPLCCTPFDNHDGLFDLCEGCSGVVTSDLDSIALFAAEGVSDYLYEEVPALCPCLSVCPECAEPTAPDEWSPHSVAPLCINCDHYPFAADA